MVPITDPTAGKFYGRNESILVSRILGDLPLQLRERIDAAAQAALQRQACGEEVSPWGLNRS